MGHWNRNLFPMAPGSPNNSVGLSFARGHAETTFAAPASQQRRIAGHCPSLPVNQPLTTGHLGGAVLLYPELSTLAGRPARSGGAG